MKTIFLILLLLPCLIFGQTKVSLNSGGGTSSGQGIVGSGGPNQLAYYNSSGTTVDPLTAITASRALASSASGLPVAAATTATELGYVSGVTSAIQTQLNTKASLTGAETLTNKTLTTPIISTIVNTGNFAIPTVSGTAVQYVANTIVSSSTPSPTGNARVNYYDITNLAVNATVAAPSGTLINHNVLIIRVQCDGNTRTLNWNATFRGGADIPLPSSITGTQILYMSFEYNTNISARWDLTGLTTL